MTTIKITTKIPQPIEKVFDLSRSIDFHMESAAQSKEQAIGGRTSGLIELHETVTWRGRHFGFFLTHQSKITAFTFPFHFTDEMLNGHFKSFKHDHFFEQREGYTLMTDVLEYEVPYGFLGRIFDILFLKSHLTNFLEQRNLSLKKG